MASQPQAPRPAMASPPPFFGEEDLDLSGLDEDMLLHLLDDDGEMLLPPPPPPQEPYAPPPAPIVQPQPNNATSSAPLAPLPLAASTQPALLQPRPAAAALAPRPAVHPVPIAPSIKPRGPLVLPKGYTATGTATVAATSAPPPIAPRPLATAGVKRKASSSSSSSSSSVSAASSVASGPSGGMDEKEAVAMEVERAVAALEEQGLDPKELKKQRRLIRNRVASQLHRERQRAHVDGLQQQLKEKDGEIARLQARVLGLEHAVQQYQAEAAGLREERDRLLASLYNGNGHGNDVEGYTTTGSSSASSASSSPASLDHGAACTTTATGAGGAMEGGYTSNDDSSVAGSTSSSSGGSQNSSPRFRPSFGSFTSSNANGGTGGGSGGFPLFGALFLFTFLAAPSTLLLSLGRGRTTTQGDGLGGLLPQRPAVAVPPTAGPLVAVSAIRDLALPFTATAGSGSSGGGGGGKGQEEGPQYWPPVLYGPHLPMGDGEHRRRSSTDTEGFLISPLERTPGKWRRGEGAAPWQYSEALDILPSPSNSNSSSLWHPPSAPAPAPSPPTNPTTTTRLRARATLKDASGHPPPGSHDEGEGEGRKQLDFYVGRTRRDADAEAVAADGGGVGGAGGKGGEGGGETSYMFCPQAFGMMAPGLSSAYWRHVEAFLALPEAEQRAARRRLLAQQEAEEEEEEEEERVYNHHHHRHYDDVGDGEGSGRKNNTGSAVAAGSEDPRLLLLVPARSVDWGHGGQQQHASQYGQGGNTEAWLEVGCRLTSMRLVNDVRFPQPAAAGAGAGAGAGSV